MKPRAGMNGELTSPSRQSPQHVTADECTLRLRAVVAYGRPPMVRMAGTEDGCWWGPAGGPASGSPWHTPSDKDPVSPLLLVHLHQRPPH